MEQNNEQENLLVEEKSRLKKLERIKDAGINPYPDRFNKKHTIQECLAKNENEKVQTAGRLILIRTIGKLTFAHIQDFDGKIQIALDQRKLGEKKYKFFTKNIDIGDFIGVKGIIGFTKTKELTIFVEDYTFLGKALKPLPAKWHGLQNKELKYRHRYLDLISNEDTRKIFKFRSEFIKLLREFYWKNNFQEVETPILCNSASGALAKPFVTHYNALDIDVFLRIAPEIYLKECIIGGYEKIFEIGRVFRNEGIDASHLQDFTMVEHYCAYWNFVDNMKFTEKMFSFLIPRLLGTTKVQIPDRDGNLKLIEFKPPWKKFSFRDLIKRDADIDIDEFETAEDLRKIIKQKKIEIEDIDKLGRGNLIDALYKKVSRPKIIEPTFIIHHPIDLSPLARKNDKNPKVVDRFQLVINGWEVVNAYSELVDPIDQEKRFEEQAKLKAQGDEEAHSKDDEYIEAMKYGMPPISGWGMGIDRIVALLTGQTNLRDVVLFPLLRPKNENK